MSTTVAANKDTAQRVLQIMLAEICATAAGWREVMVDA